MGPNAMQPLRLALFQSAPRLRDPAWNAARIATAAADVVCDLFLTPELSLTGYDVGDEASALAVPLPVGGRLRFAGDADGEMLRDLAPLLVLGLLEADDAFGAPFNTAAVLDRGDVVFRHRKIYLPTYGMFDEGRWFARGGALDVCPLPGGWRAGILVCEDFWHPGLTYVLAAARIHVLLVLAAAPGRGVIEGGAAGGAFASADAWERIARATAQQYGIYVCLANRVGVEGGVTFAGGSLVVDPAARVCARADSFTEELLEVVLDPHAMAAARSPYAHARDDDVRLVARELAQWSA
jgi:predicted amidohydrolase